MKTEWERKKKRKCPSHNKLTTNMKEKIGKVSTATTDMKRKKKKGRPDQTKHRLTPPVIPKSHNHPNIYNILNNTPSSSPNCNLPLPSPPPFDDDEDERKDKKVKLVVRLPKSNLNHLKKSSKNADSDSDSDSAPDDDVYLGGSPNKRKINEDDCRSGDTVAHQEEKVSTAIDVLQGSQLEPGPTTPLPEKKLLLFILDRLQKKDTHGVFSEPVDPDELPDYHEIVEQPMDFGTVKKKLDRRAYTNLEELEADILLICSNAMQYNAPDTVYYRQACSIQEIARRDFTNLRHEGDDGEPQPKIVRRGRPPGKTQKKHLEKSSVDRIGPEIASDVTLASGEEKGSRPNSSYSLRKTSSLNRFRSSDGFFTPNRSSIGENGSEWSIDWSNEFPASILRADMKHGNKNITVDVTKRDSYREYQPPGSDNDLSGLLNIDEDMKWLMPVSLNFAQHAYARSLAKFAANFGPVAWKVASRKFESVLPAGVKFGPGWVRDTEALPSFSGEKQKSPSHLAADLHSSETVATPSTPGENLVLHQSRPSEQMVEAIRRLNSQNELPLQSGGSAWGFQGFPHQALQKTMFNPSRNGFSGIYGQSLSQLGMSSPAVAHGLSGQQEGLSPYQRLGVVQRNDASSSVHPASSSSVHHASSYDNLGFEESKFSHSSNMLVKGKALEPNAELEASQPYYEYWPAEQKPRPPIPPDLNVRVPGASSLSSSLVIGSPQQQPDLALQL